MNFINLQVFWWIPVILIFMVILFWRARVRRTNIMQLILGSRAKDDKHVQLSLARRLFRFLLLLFVILMLIVAIARPTWKLKLVPYQTRGRDLIVLFDVSKSMLAQDIRPSRLAHAKLFLRDLVNQTGSDRFGLVAFAGRAFLECPMTTDKTSFIQYIDELDTESIPLGGTNLQLALETAMEAFKAAEGNNRAIILITDGDELSGNSKLALKELKNKKIPLLIVGVGSSVTPALIPIPQKKGKSVKFMRDSKGELVKTRLNAVLMQQLADTTGGYFVHSTTTNFGLSQIEAGIKKLLPKELEKGEKTRPVERFYYFLAFATILLWLWMLISEHPGKKRKHLAKATTIFMISALFAVQNTANAQKTEPLAKHPAPKNEPPVPPITDSVQAYNQAREIQLKKKKGDSSKLYETAINLAGEKPAVRTNSYNNLGVIQHQKARQAVMQAIGQVKKQNLDGAISQLESAKNPLNLAEEMYVKALSTEIPEKSDENQKITQGAAKNQSAVNQQLLLNDRVMIDDLIKKIKELKKQQEKAQKQTKKAQKQQKKKNKQKKQDKKKQDKKQQDKKQQDKKQQDKKQQDKKQQEKKQQNKKQQDKKQQKKSQKQDKKQQQKSNDELKKAQEDVKKLENQAKDLGQKNIEKQAQKAKKELKKAEKARKDEQGKKAEDHIKKALEQLKPKGSDKDKDKKDKKGKDNKDKQKNKDKKKDKGKDGKDKKDKKLPKPQEQSAKQGEAKKAPKDINPKEARKLLKMMTEKEKDFRKALKAHRKQQYKNIKVEKDW
jgi:Ca-activated chloride channel homolog